MIAMISGKKLDLALTPKQLPSGQTLPKRGIAAETHSIRTNGTEK